MASEDTLLHFQLAGADHGYLLEHLLLESIGAVRGGGIFAWANAGGAKTLIADPTFLEFLKDGNFRLFVGLDSITDKAAVQMLSGLQTNHARLDVRAFLNTSGGLFHPKLAWFEHEDSLRLIVGSGNLTMGGLKSNWEAFTVTCLMGAEAKSALLTVEGWLSDRSSEMVPITDPRVLARASLNTGSERNLRNVRSTPPESLVVSEAASVLVAAIPKSDDRWSQANFDLNNYQTFFGASLGSQRRISLYHVETDGSLGPLESRPSVQVASHNYRFELAAAKGRTYPTSGRPIGVFVRLTTGQFLYTLLLPGDPGYGEVEGLMNSKWNGPARNVPRIRCEPNELQASWPLSPIWQATLPAL